MYIDTDYHVQLPVKFTADNSLRVVHVLGRPTGCVGMGWAGLGWVEIFSFWWVGLVRGSETFPEF